MHPRGHIRDETAAISPHDSQETSDHRWTLDWIDSGAELFRTKKPDVPKVHLVAYFVVVDPTSDSILLQHHLLAKKWLPSGVHVDPGELLTTTVARECEEELGLRAAFLGKPTARFVTVTEVTDTIDD